MKEDVDYNSGPLSPEGGTSLEGFSKISKYFFLLIGEIGVKLNYFTDCYYAPSGG